MRNAIVTVLAVVAHTGALEQLSQTNLYAELGLASVF